MSAYNVLKFQVKCPNCDQTQYVDIQFKFGDTWQFQYKIGDTIRWGGNDVGSPGIKKVKVYGILETDCNNCNYYLSSEFDIYIEDDVIRAVKAMQDINDYKEENDYCFCILP